MPLLLLLLILYAVMLGCSVKSGETMWAMIVVATVCLLPVKEAKQCVLCNVLLSSQVVQCPITQGGYTWKHENLIWPLF